MELVSVFIEVSTYVSLFKKKVNSEAHMRKLCHEEFTDLRYLTEKVIFKKNWYSKIFLGVALN